MVVFLLFNLFCAVISGVGYFATYRKVTAVSLAPLCTQPRRMLFSRALIENQVTLAMRSVCVCG